MIKIKIKANKDKLSITVEGHAGAAEQGQDPVCGAASILVYTIAQMVREMQENNMLKKEAKIFLESGRSGVSCAPKKEYYELARQNYRTISTGFLLLQESFPDYVKII